MQHNSFAWEVKGIDDAGHIEGIAAGYGNVDFGGDRILPGAFKDALLGRKSVPMLLFHDHHRPVGRWTEFLETDEGLFAKGKISTKTRDGGEAYELAKDGALAGLSIGYDCPPEGKRMAGKVRELLKLDLHEVSLVSIGMNPRAQIHGVKDMENLRNRFAAGERLTERELEALFKAGLSLSNAEAERAVRVHGLKIGQGEPGIFAGDPMEALWAAMSEAPIIDLTGDSD